MAITLWLDSVNGDDDYDGSTETHVVGPPETGPKLTRQGIRAILPDQITEETIVKHVHGTYTDDIDLDGIHCVKDGKLVFEPKLFLESSYLSGKYSPFDASVSQGEFGIELEDKPVINKSKISIANCNNVVIRGFHIYDDVQDGVTDRNVQVMNSSGIFFQYNRFEGLGAGLQAYLNNMVFVENCCFKDQKIGILCTGFSRLILSGDNSIIDALFRGIYAMVDSTVWIFPWTARSREFYTTRIKTTKATVGKYAAVEAGANTTIFVTPVSPHEVSPIPAIGKLEVINDFTSLSDDYRGIILNSRSLLVGKSNCTFTTLDSKGWTTEMPIAQQVVKGQGEDTTSTD